MHTHATAEKRLRIRLIKIQNFLTPAPEKGIVKFGISY